MSRTLSAIAVSAVISVLAIAVYHYSFKEKVAYVDLIRVYQEYDMSKDLNQELVDYQINRKSRIDSSYVTQSTDGDNSALRTALQKQYYNLENELSQKDSRNQGLLADKVNDGIEKFSASNDYDVILGANGNGSILFARDQLDITDAFIEFINKEYNDQ